MKLNVYLSSLIFFLTFCLLITPVFADDAQKLIEKVMNQDLEGLKQIISEGVNVNAQDEGSGSTALMLACSYNFTDMAKLLLDNGANPNIQDKNGNTAIFAAAQRSQPLVELLLSKGADIKIKNNKGTTVFTSSMMGILRENTSSDLPLLLLKKGADVDEAPTSGPTEGFTCLMMMVRNNHLEMTQLLIKHGANVKAKAKNGKTALSLAEKKKNSEMIKLLKSKGASE